MNNSFSRQYMELYLEIKTYQQSFLAKFRGLFGSNENLETGDLCFLQPKSNYHFVVAAYYYYLAFRDGNKKAFERLNLTLDLPEVTSFFIENDLAFDKKLVLFPMFLNELVVPFTEYVTKKYAGNLQKSENHSICFVTNLMMLKNIISNYGFDTNHAQDDTPTLDSNIDQAREYHKRWWYGDVGARGEFLAILKNIDTADLESLQAQWRKKNRENSEKGVHVSYKEFHKEFMGIVHQIIKQRKAEEEREVFRKKIENAAEKVLEDYPQFDLKKEMSNPEFEKLVSLGLNMRIAYEYIHRDAFFEKKETLFDPANPNATEKDFYEILVSNISVKKVESLEGINYDELSAMAKKEGLNVEQLRAVRNLEAANEELRFEQKKKKCENWAKQAVILNCAYHHFNLEKMCKIPMFWSLAESFNLRIAYEILYFNEIYVRKEYNEVKEKHLNNSYVGLFEECFESMSMIVTKRTSKIELKPEIFALLYIVMDCGVLQSGKDRNVFTKSVISYVHESFENDVMLIDEFNQRVDFFTEFIRGKKPRVEWMLLNAEPVSSDPLLRCTAAFGDLLFNPDLIKEYDHPALTIPDVLDAMSFASSTMMEINKCIANLFKSTME